MSVQKNKIRKRRSRHRKRNTIVWQDVIDDLWIKSFGFLHVYDFCAIHKTCKRFWQITRANLNNKIMNDYWKNQAMLLGCNENFYDDIYDNAIKPRMTFFTPPNNDWFAFYSQFYQVLSARDFIFKISINMYRNHVYNEKNRTTENSKENENKNENKEDQNSAINCMTFTVHSSKISGNHSRLPKHPIGLSKYMSKLINLNISKGEYFRKYTFAGYCCLHNYIHVIRYLLAWDKYIATKIERINKTYKLSNQDNLQAISKNSEKATAIGLKKKLNGLRLSMFALTDRKSDISPTLLSIATKYKHYQLIKYLLNDKTIGNHSRCASNELQEALCTNNMKIVAMYLDPNINMKLRTGKMKLNYLSIQSIGSPLHWACECRNINFGYEIIEILVDTLISDKYSQWINIRPVDLNIRDNNGQTPLMKSLSTSWRCRCVNEASHLKIVKLLLNEQLKDKVDLFIQDYNQNSIFTLAVERNFYTIVVYIYNYFIKYYKYHNNIYWNKSSSKNINVANSYEITMIRDFFDCQRCLTIANTTEMIQFLDHIRTVTATMDSFVYHSKLTMSKSKECGNSESQSIATEQNLNVRVRGPPLKSTSAAVQSMLRKKPIICKSKPK